MDRRAEPAAARIAVTIDLDRRFAAQIELDRAAGTAGRVVSASHSRASPCSKAGILNLREGRHKPAVSRRVSGATPGRQRACASLPPCVPSGRTAAWRPAGADVHCRGSRDRAAPSCCHPADCCRDCGPCGGPWLVHVRVVELARATSTDPGKQSQRPAAIALCTFVAGLARFGHDPVESFVVGVDGFACRHGTDCVPVGGGQGRAVAGRRHRGYRASSCDRPRSVQCR